MSLGELRRVMPEVCPMVRRLAGGRPDGPPEYSDVDPDVDPPEDP